MNTLKALVLTAMLACLPVAASASSSSYANSGGTVTAINGGTAITLTGSVLTTVTGGTCISTCTGNLGTVSFTTGALTSGSLATGGTFAAGGSFTVMGNGSNGLSNGLLFHGTFTSATWTAVWDSSGDHHGYWTYQLTGTVSGTLSNGQRLSENFVAFTFDVSHGQQFSSAVRFNDGAMAVAVPEPGTLSLLCSGPPTATVLI
jgi:hypothetical protein